MKELQKKVTHLPCIKPIKHPTVIADKIAYTPPLNPNLLDKITRTTAQNPETEPADKSISPKKRTKQTPRGHYT